MQGTQNMILIQQVCKHQIKDSKCYKKTIRHNIVVGLDP